MSLTQGRQSFSKCIITRNKNSKHAIQAPMHCHWRVSVLWRTILSLNNSLFDLRVLWVLPRVGRALVNASLLGARIVNIEAGLASCASSPAIFAAEIKVVNPLSCATCDTLLQHEHLPHVTWHQPAYTSMFSWNKWIVETSKNKISFFYKKHIIVIVS